MSTSCGTIRSVERRSWHSRPSSQRSPPSTTTQSAFLAEPASWNSLERVSKSLASFSSRLLGSLSILSRRLASFHLRQSRPTSRRKLWRWTVTFAWRRHSTCFSRKRVTLVWPLLFYPRLPPRSPCTSTRPSRRTRSAQTCAHSTIASLPMWWVTIPSTSRPSPTGCLDLLCSSRRTIRVGVWPLLLPTWPSVLKNSMTQRALQMLLVVLTRLTLTQKQPKPRNCLPKLLMRIRRSTTKATSQPLSLRSQTLKTSSTCFKWMTN